MVYALFPIIVREVQKYHKLTLFMENSNCKRISSIFFGRNIFFFYFMDDFAKEEALLNCCQKRPWLQSIKVYILQKIASPSNFRTCMDVCKCFAQMRKPQKNSSVKMHISLVVSWVPRNSFLLPPFTCPTDSRN